MRYDSIVNEYFEKQNRFFDRFLEVIKEGDHKEYVLSNLQKRSWGDLSDVCHQCIFEQVRKYKDHLDTETSSGKVGNSFKVKCEGIPREYISEEVFKVLGVLDPEARIKLLATRDPVAWAELYAYTEDGKPWRAREQQKVMLRCTSSRAIFRCGRRLGKCLGEDTPILTSRGVKPIKEIVPGDLVYAFNTKAQTTTLVPVKAKHDNGIQEVFDLFENGRYIGSCTKDHRWLVKVKDEYKVLPLIEISSENNFCVVESGIFKTTQLTIESKSLNQTYDLEIETEDHLFLTGHGLVTHNSDAIVIKMLFNAINLPNRPMVEIDGVSQKQPLTFLVITPRQTHSDNLWRKIEAQINSSSLIRDSMVDYKRYPYIDIRFQNGSKIFIMTAGTGGANAGLSIRSFSADYLILDEGNYLGPEELKSALAILATNAECKLIVSSTPMGIQDFFYDWCFRAPEYKEFHFPTPLLPHWDSVKSNIYQDTQSVDDFLHEYMAEFSPPGHTVFRIDLIQKATRNYVYRDMLPNPNFRYSIGIDWNSTVGSEIIVTGFDTEANEYIVVENVNIGRSEWTQLASCEAVIEMIKKWNPFIVVADEGYGATQIEILRATALRTPDPRLQNITEILVPYNFSSKIEIFDPVTKQPIKKSAKPFLVRNAVSRFEEENILISAEDRLLIEQLSLYQIKSVSNLGLPVYWVPQDDVGDHRLDAFMLSLVGFKMKQSFLFENGGSVYDVGYIAPRDSSLLDPDKKKQVAEEGFKSLHISQRGGTVLSRLPNKVGRRNVG